MVLSYLLRHCLFMQQYDITLFVNDLCRTHMQDLKDVTNDVHYENFRCKRLATVTVGSPTITT